ncbi:hypothetical protein THIOSC15_950003 [uncultured Thiomicrorhabdus sp.]
MIFTTYGRFVPNLTRQDGSAFESLMKEKTSVANSITPQLPAMIGESEATFNEAMLETDFVLNDKEVNHG